MAGEEDDDLDITLGSEDDAPANDDAAAEAEAGDDGEAGGETVIAFADEADEDGEDEADLDEKATRLIRDLRGKLREAQSQVARSRKNPAPANDGDPEPQVPDEPGGLETFDYDEDAQREAWRKFNAANEAHAKWELRQKDREAERNRAAERQAKQIEQQRSSLGVADYEERAQIVRDRLSEAQIAVLTNGAANPAKLIYALGRSPSKLEQLASEENLARFAVMVGGMERDIKVTKRNAPAADTRVRGATASPALNDRNAKTLAKLEKEAARTGDRTALIQFRKSLKAA